MKKVAVLFTVLFFLFVNAFSKDYVKLKLESDIDLTITPQLEFGFEYSKNKKVTKCKGGLFGTPFSEKKFQKFDLHVMGSPYRGDHKLLTLRSSDIQKTKGLIPVSYRHPQKTNTLVLDTIRIPFPKSFKFKIDEISFSVKESLSLIVFYENGNVREYSHHYMIQFLESYGFNLEVENGELFYGLSEGKSLWAKKKNDKLLKGLPFYKYFKGRTSPTSILEEHEAFEVVLTADAFSSKLLDQYLSLSLSSNVMTHEHKVKLLPNGSYSVVLYGETGRMGSAGHRGDNGGYGPSVDVNITPYNDSLYKFVVSSERSVERKFVIDPRYGGLRIVSFGGNGGDGGTSFTRALSNGYAVRGSRGMNGGDGGDGGDVTIYYPFSFKRYKNVVEAFSYGGKPGAGGMGGPGLNQDGTQSYALRGLNGQRGRNGRNGRVSFLLTD